jgi:FtsZ-binding cell division protein ZapB
VSNLKKLLSKIQAFLEKANEKTDRLREIDVVEIAKHSSPHHIARLFEVIVSVLMNSPHKEKYIQLIMALDETSQNTFVEIIQNSLDQQLFANEEPQSVQLQQEIRELKEENTQLKGEVNDLQRKNKNLLREVKDLKEKIINYEEELEQAKTADVSVNSDGIHTQLEQQRVLIDNLKARLMATVRENELEMSQMREEISVLRLKTQNYEEIESNLEEYKELYSQTTAELLRMGELEREKRKLQRTIEEKEQMIRKLQDKIEASLEKNYTLEENEIYMKLELEKREVRFKQLEKEVKTRLKSEPSEPLHQKDKEQKELKEQK